MNMSTPPANGQCPEDSSAEEGAVIVRPDGLPLLRQLPVRKKLGRFFHTHIYGPQPPKWLVSGHGNDLTQLPDQVGGVTPPEDQD